MHVYVALRRLTHAPHSMYYRWYYRSTSKFDRIQSSSTLWCAAQSLQNVVSFQMTQAAASLQVNWHTAMYINIYSAKYKTLQEHIQLLQCELRPAADTMMCWHVYHATTIVVVLASTLSRRRCAVTLALLATTSFLHSIMQLAGRQLDTRVL